MTDVDDEWMYAAVEGPFRDGKIWVLSEKCSTCIFRPGNKMHLREGTVESMVQGCIEEDSYIPCHDTIIYGPKAICRGFYDLHRQDIPILRLAAAFGIFAFEPPPEED